VVFTDEGTYIWTSLATFAGRIPMLQWLTCLLFTLVQIDSVLTFGSLQWTSITSGYYELWGKVPLGRSELWREKTPGWPSPWNIFAKMKVCILDWPLSTAG
jgi:hypothetical protein